MLSIRRAVPDDAAALAEFGARTFEEAFGKDNRSDDMRAYIAKHYGEAQQRRELEDPRIITLLGEQDGRLAAFAQLRCDGDVEIARFYVDRPWHGRGIAHELMRAVLEVAGKSRVWLAVWPKNTRAIAFYRKHGFRRCGSQPFLLGSDLQTDDVMERVPVVSR